MSEVQTSCSSFAPKRALFGCRAIHDVKATDMGLSKVRFKAEVDFDGRVVTRSYLEKQDIDQILNVGFFFFVSMNLLLFNLLAHEGSSIRRGKNFSFNTTCIFL